MGEPSRPCRILVVDDHDFMREAIKAILEREPSLEVAGEAKDGPRAIGTFQREGAMRHLRNGPLRAYYGFLGLLFVGQGSHQGRLAFFRRSAGEGGGSCAVKILA